MTAILQCESVAANSQQSNFALPSSKREQPRYEQVTFEDGCRMVDFRPAAHVLIYSFDDRLLFNKYKAFANILMQMRFDGTYGFSGGLIDEADASIVEGLNRELVEEINLDLTKHRVEQKHHVVSHFCTAKKLVTHFYALEVTTAEFEEIERRVLTAHDWGSETLGVFRAPLFTMNDNCRGLPTFLTGRFIGNSRQQLIDTLRIHNILPQAELDRAVSLSETL